VNLAIIEVALSSIQLPKHLLKSHPAHQIEQIAASIKAFGFNDPVGLDENNAIIEGVGRVLAAKQLKLETIPIIRLEHLSEPQKQAYRIAHNKICLNTGFDLDALKEVFEELCALDEATRLGKSE
jgi:ParB-like chromosome segregation protein Spo0J